MGEVFDIQLSFQSAQLPNRQTPRHREEILSQPAGPALPCRMARVDLELELAEPGKVYGPRDLFKGVVHVTVHEPVEVNTLEISFTLTMASEHATTSMPAKRTKNLFTGRWEPGQYDYEFEMPGPRWPQSYKWVIIDWQWACTAKADLHMARDAEDHYPITMRIPQQDGLRVVHKNPGNRAAVTGSLKGPLVITSILAADAAIGIAFDIGPMMATGIGFGIIALLLLLYSWMKLRDVGAPQLFVTSVDEPEPALDCELLVKPSAKVARVAGSLYVYERKRVSSGPNNRGTKTYEGTILEQPFELAPAEPGVYRGRVALPTPDRVPYTVEVLGSSIGWQIKGVIHMEDKVTYPLPIGVLWALPARGKSASVGS